MRYKKCNEHANNSKTIRDMADVKKNTFEKSEIMAIKKCERSRVKEKNFEDNGSKKSRPKRRKEIVKKDILARRLTIAIAQDHSLYELGCKNRLTPACNENKRSSSRRKKLSILQKTNR